MTRPTLELEGLPLSVEGTFPTSQVGDSNGDSFVCFLLFALDLFFIEYLLILGLSHQYFGLPESIWESLSLSRRLAWCPSCVFYFDFSLNSDRRFS